MIVHNMFYFSFSSAVRKTFFAPSRLQVKQRFTKFLGYSHRSWIWQDLSFKLEFFLNNSVELDRLWNFQLTRPVLYKNIPRSQKNSPTMKNIKISKYSRKISFSISNIQFTILVWKSVTRTSSTTLPPTLLSPNLASTSATSSLPSSLTLAVTIVTSKVPPPRSTTILHVSSTPFCNWMVFRATDVGSITGRIFKTSNCSEASRSLLYKKMASSTASSVHLLRWKKLMFHQSSKVCWSYGDEKGGGNPQ